MRSRIGYIALGLIVGVFFDAGIALAWTGPTASAPNSNTGAPINVGTTAQVKNGDFGANNISAFGNALLSGLGVGTGRYINFDFTSGGTSGTGSSGYGIRDNAGTLEFKNTGGSWQSLQTIVAGFAGFWTSASGGISYTGGRVGIGVATPATKLDVRGDGSGASDIRSYDYSSTNTWDTGSFGALRARGTQASPTYPLQWDRLGSYWSGNAVNPQAWAGMDVYASENHSATAQGMQINFNVTKNGGVGAQVAMTLGNDGRVTTEQEVMAKLGSNSAGQIRMIGGNYGAIWRNDGANTYLLFTNSGDQWGTWNSLRPISFSDTTGNVTSSHNISAAAFLYSSDARLKKNVQSLDQGIVELMKLRPVSFTWNEKSIQPGRDDIGFIAQEVEKVVPGVVHTDEKGYEQIDYVKLTPILVKAMQEQQSEIEALKARLDKLENN